MTATQPASRRHFLLAAGSALGAGALPAAVPTPPVRRVVTVQAGPDRGEVVFADAELPVVSLNGSRITRLWETPGVPVDLAVTADAGAAAGNAYREGFAGTSLYVAELPPRGQPGALVPMHREDSLDYIAVLAGEIHLRLADQVVRLAQGDVLVQAGNAHAWENRAAEPCRLLVVVLRATAPPPAA